MPLSIRHIIFAFFLFSGVYSFGQKISSKQYRTSDIPVTQNFLLNYNEPHNIMEVHGVKDSIYKLANKKKIKILKNLSSNEWIVDIIKPINSSEFSSLTNFYLVNNLWKLSDRFLGEYNVNNLKAESYIIVGISKEDLEDILKVKSIDYKILSHHELTSSTHVIISKATNELFSFLMSFEEISFIDIHDGKLQTEALLKFQDLTINQVNKVHSAFPTINGNGITVSIKEFKYNVTDIDLLSRTKISGLESGITDAHATDMATIIGGAGNSFYQGKGAAWGCDFSSSSFENIFPDPESTFNDLLISVQNHSYGFLTPDNQYGAESRAYDLNMNQNLSLLHVISAGNIGQEVSSSGTYKDIIGYANLSGSFKMSKNNLIVSSIDELYDVDVRNSAGPAYDGRLKPELVAYGKTGTSDAAAMVSGVSGVLQQYYFEMKGQKLESALLKGILIAGSEDVGATGIDFKTGYGNLNAFHSTKIIEQDQFTSSILLDGIQDVIDIQVPANVSEIKVVLTWNDPAANAGDAIALVNDLDLTVSNIDTNETWLPWVLDVSPDAILLAKEAVRKDDHLNNVEMITIENPLAGNYQFKINGSGLISGEQQYHIVYNFEYDNAFEWNFPVSKDKVIGAQDTTIRWNSNVIDITSFEYTIDGGLTWSEIALNVSLSNGSLKWNVPDVVAECRLRTFVNGIYVESESFIIAPLLNMTVGFDCDNAFMLQWDPVNGVDSYEIYGIGNKYLEHIESITNNYYVFDKASFKNQNYTVAPKFNGNEGAKSLAFNYQLQGVKCYYRNFLVANFEDQYVVMQLNISSTLNVKEIGFERSADSINYVNIATMNPALSQLSYSFNDENPITGFSYYRAYLILNDNTKILIENVEVFFPDENTMIVFPNPIEKFDFFTLLSKSGNSILELVDMRGAVVYQWDVNTDVSTHTLPSLNSGVYFLRIIRNGKMAGRKRLVVY